MFITTGTNKFTSISRKTGDGAVFHVELKTNTDEFKLSSCTFETCEATSGDGGAVYINYNHEDATVTFKTVTLKNNKVGTDKYGGSIYIKYSKRPNKIWTWGGITKDSTTITGWSSYPNNKYGKYIAIVSDDNSENVFNSTLYGTFDTSIAPNSGGENFVDCIYKYTYKNAASVLTMDPRKSATDGSVTKLSINKDSGDDTSCFAEEDVACKTFLHAYGLTHTWNASNVLTMKTAVDEKLTYNSLLISSPITVTADTIQTLTLSLGENYNEEQVIKVKSTFTLEKIQLKLTKTSSTATPITMNLIKLSGGSSVLIIKDSVIGDTE